jgi:hypothetical protein
MVVDRKTYSGSPPVLDADTEVISGKCNAQVGSGGGTTNEQEAMKYDWTVYYPVEYTAEVKVNDIVTINKFGIISEAKVVRAEQGQLSNRIWADNVSS